MLFPDLDLRTRMLMIEELALDLMGGGVLCVSPRLSDQGRLDWSRLLQAALAGGDPEWLARKLRRKQRLQATEARVLASGKSVAARVPDMAAKQLAEGEFNRYYARAVCRRAIELGTPVQVYRARDVVEPRPASQAKLGSLVDPAAVLQDLRRHTSEEVPALGIPGGPSSGLSVRLPRGR